MTVCRRWPAWTEGEGRHLQGEAEGKLLPGKSGKRFHAETYGHSPTSGRCICRLPPTEASDFPPDFFVTYMGGCTGQGSYLSDWEAAQRELRLGSRETWVWKGPARLCGLGESPHLSILAFLICGRMVRPTGLPWPLSGSKKSRICSSRRVPSFPKRDFGTGHRLEEAC